MNSLTSYTVYLTNGKVRDYKSLREVQEYYEESEVYRVFVNHPREEPLLVPDWATRDTSKRSGVVYGGLPEKVKPSSDVALVRKEAMPRTCHDLVV